MPSSPTQRIRAEKVSTGEALNTWGSLVNGALDRFDEAVAGVTTVAISGASTVLTSSNYAADQARAAVLVLTGTLTANSTVTVPNAEKTYIVVNNTTQGAFSLTLKTAAGSGYALRPGPQAVYCNGTDVFRATPRLDQVPAAAASVDLGGQKITNLGTPTASTDAVTKAYADLVGAGADTAATANSIAKRDGSANLSTAAFLADLGSAAAPSYSFASDTDTGVFRAGADSLAVSTGGAVRTVVNASGDLFHGQISTTSPGVDNQTLGSCLWGEGRLFLSGSGGSALNVQATGSMLLFSYLGVARGSITTDGSSISYNTTSDYRLKSEIEPLSGAVERLGLLQPKRFRWQGSTAPKVDGFLAHEVVPAVAEAVRGEKDGAEMQQMDPSKLIPLLVAAVQELAARVEALENP